MSAHKRIKNMAASSRPQGDAASQHTSECSICLMSIAVRHDYPLSPTHPNWEVAELTDNSPATAMPSTLRCALLACMAFQMHPPPRRQGIPKLSVPQLPGNCRSRTRYRGGRAGNILTSRYRGRRPDPTGGVRGASRYCDGGRPITPQTEPAAESAYTGRPPASLSGRRPGHSRRRRCG